MYCACQAIQDEPSRTNHAGGYAFGCKITCVLCSFQCLNLLMFLLSYSQSSANSLNSLHFLYAEAPTSSISSSKKVIHLLVKSIKNLNRRYKPDMLMYFPTRAIHEDPGRINHAGECERGCLSPRFLLPFHLLNVFMLLLISFRLLAKSLKAEQCEYATAPVCNITSRSLSMHLPIQSLSASTLQSLCL